MNDEYKVCLRISGFTLDTIYGTETYNSRIAVDVAASKRIVGFS